MHEAIKEAGRASALDEIPIGAVIVREGKVIGRGFNTRKACGSPFGHAEMAAMKEASAALGSWRFDGCTLYVTLEPCAMCAGAAVQCRMGKIVYGAKDPNGGAAGSLYDIPRDPRMYHRCAVVSGVQAAECSKLLSDFFIKRRRSHH